MTVFIYFFGLCLLGLTVKLNFNIKWSIAFIRIFFEEKHGQTFIINLGLLQKGTLHMTPSYQRARERLIRQSRLWGRGGNFQGLSTIYTENWFINSSRKW